MSTTQWPAGLNELETSPVSSVKPSLIPIDVLQEAQREAQANEASSFVQPTPPPLPMAGSRPVAAPATPQITAQALSSVPLFRDLPAASLALMAEGAQHVEVRGGEVLFREGDTANSFFVALEGTLELLRHKEGREVALRHVAAREAFGLFGLLSAHLRAATAKAIGDCTLIEIDAEQLKQVVTREPVLNQRLIQFYRERLVEGFLSSRLFSDIDSVGRACLIGRFKHHELSAKQVLLHPGEVTNMMAVVTFGQLILEDRSKIGQPPREFSVTQGQFLAITGALSGVPASLRVVAPEYSTLAMLPHKDMHELMRDYPALRTLPTRLPRYARALDRVIFCGSTGVPGL